MLKSIGFTLKGGRRGEEKCQLLTEIPSVLWLFLLVGSVDRVYLKYSGKVLSCKKLEDLGSSTRAFKPQFH